MCVVNIIQFVHTIKFNSNDHNNVSFIERIKNFHFSCHGYYSFKSCLKYWKIAHNYVVSDWSEIGEDEQVKKGKKHGLCAIAYQNIFQELYLEDKKGTLT